MNVIKSKALVGFRPYFGEFGRDIPPFIARFLERAALSTRIRSLLCIHDDTFDEIRRTDDDVTSGILRCHVLRSSKALFSSLSDDDRAKLVFALDNLYRSDVSFDAAAFAGTILMLRLTSEKEISGKIDAIYQRAAGLVFSYDELPWLKTKEEVKERLDRQYLEFGSRIKDVFGLPQGMIPVPLRPSYRS